MTPNCSSKPWAVLLSGGTITPAFKINRSNRSVWAENRWAKIEELGDRQNHRGDISPLHRQAFQLGTRLRQILQLEEHFGKSGIGITDSLLWGDGHPNSDIDLVVIGSANTAKLIADVGLLYSDEDFDRPDPELMQSPYGLEVQNWPRILQRKLHMGSFRGRLFSVRAVRDREGPVAAEHIQNVGRKRIRFAVVDSSESLFFPATYRDDCGNELVDYSVVYEGVFQSGDRVLASCDVERVSVGSRHFDRYVIAGPVEFQ